MAKRFEKFFFMMPGLSNAINFGKWKSETGSIKSSSSSSKVLPSSQIQ